MSAKNETIPDPKELEKEIGDLLAKKFGGTVKLSTPIVIPQEAISDKSHSKTEKSKSIKFDLKPDDLIAYLDQYIVKQDEAKAILSTKICTHFNRIRHYQNTPDEIDDMVGRIKNNVLMI